MALLQAVFMDTPRRYKGLGYGLLGQLDSTWQQRCCMIEQTDSHPAPPNDTAPDSLCRKLIFCVCQGQGSEAYHFHKNLISLFRPFLEAKRRTRAEMQEQKARLGRAPKPVYTQARQWLQSGFLVLRLSPFREVPDLREDQVPVL